MNTCHYCGAKRADYCRVCQMYWCNKHWCGHRRPDGYDYLDNLLDVRVYSYPAGQGDVQGFGTFLRPATIQEGDNMTAATISPADIPQWMIASVAKQAYYKQQASTAMYPAYSYTKPLSPWEQVQSKPQAFALPGCTCETCTYIREQKYAQSDGAQESRVRADLLSILRSYPQGIEVLAHALQEGTVVGGTFEGSRYGVRVACILGWVEIAIRGEESEQRNDDVLRDLRNRGASLMYYVDGPISMICGETPATSARARFLFDVVMEAQREQRLRIALRTPTQIADVVAQGESREDFDLFEGTVQSEEIRELVCV